MRVLYAGESLVRGSANYLFGALRACHITVQHVESSERLSPGLLARRFDVIILSDFSKGQTSRAAEEAIARQVKRGSGLLMIGGWESFGAPCGKWHGSLIEALLPVTCLPRDDRMNTPGGALIVPRLRHPILRGLSFAHPPSICGFNVIRPKRGSVVVLEAQPILSDGSRRGNTPRVRLAPRRYPLLVVTQDSSQRSAALATDLAPHWCGGLIDWGGKRLTLPVTQATRIEVGHQYVQFIASMMRWLAGGG